MIRAVLGMLVAAAVAGGGLRLFSAVAAPEVRVVRVQGALTAAERLEVRGAVTGQLGSGSRSLADLVEAVKRLGWVRSVRVRRQWPDALRIVVSRETPAARWGDNAWLDGGGRVVAAGDFVNDPALIDLPTIRVVRADGATAIDVLNRVNGVAATAGLRIAALTEGAAGDWTVTLADGTDVVLGRRALTARMERFQVVYHARLRAETRLAERQDQKARVDARYSNGLAVAWRPSASNAVVRVVGGGRALAAQGLGAWSPATVALGN